jgi:hypothetical protein
MLVLVKSGEEDTKKQWRGRCQLSPETILAIYVANNKDVWYKLKIK